MKTFTREQIERATLFFNNYLDGNVDISNISKQEIQENIALPSLFLVAFKTFNDLCQVEVRKDTKVGDFDVDDSCLEMFCYPKDGSIDAYPDPSRLLQVFLPKWFDGYAQEAVLTFNVQDKSVRNLTLQDVITAFNSVGLEIDQKILYSRNDKFLPLFEMQNKSGKQLNKK